MWSQALKTGAGNDGGMLRNLLGETVEGGCFYWFGWEMWPHQMNCVINGSQACSSNNGTVFVCFIALRGTGSTAVDAFPRVPFVNTLRVMAIDKHAENTESYREDSIKLKDWLVVI